MKNINSEVLVEALYECLLGRSYDESGKNDKVARLNSGVTSVQNLMYEFLTSVEFKQNIGVFLGRVIQNELPFTNNVSQYNEIGLLMPHMINDAVEHCVVVDIGARGKERSNSWDLLHHCGWRGILVEANPKLAEQINSEFKGLDFKFISCAVSDYTGEADFIIGINDDVSSLNVDSAKCWGETKGQIKVQVRPLAEILIAERVPLDFGLLSLDIEGEDIRVLNNLIEKSEFRPRYIIIEASYDFSVSSLNDIPVLDVVREQYQIIERTRANLILKYLGCNKTTKRRQEF